MGPEPQSFLARPHHCQQHFFFFFCSLWAMAWRERVPQAVVPGGSFTWLGHVWCTGCDELQCALLVVSVEVSTGDP